MIYKFKDEDSILELELVDENKYLNLMIENEDFKVMINIEKKEVYRLIGALHLLHKEMI